MCQKKSLVLILVKKTQNFVWVYNLMLIDNSCLFVNGKRIVNIKTDNKYVNFPKQFQKHF